jgi:KGK domain
MELNSYLQKCHENDVLSFGNDMIKFGQFKYVLEQSFSPAESKYSKVTTAINEHFKSSSAKIDYAGHVIAPNGIHCEILRIGSKGWQKGRIRVKVTLEFIPDEPEIEETPATNELEIAPPESPLDDLRQLINQNNP